MSTRDRAGHTFTRILDRCPFRKGPDRRECSLDELPCFYGISACYVPAHCPIVIDGEIRITLAIPKEAELLDESNGHR